MINENEAPAGYKAEPMARGCAFCAFASTDCPAVKCAASKRKDGQDVIFVEIEKGDGK